jgi:site-specific DNA-methyltransferase (adenine-specific)
MPISEVFNEDCMIGMSRYPDKFFDLAIVDPPYGIGYDGMRESTSSHGGRKPHKFKGWDNEIPDEDYFNELFRVSKNQIVWGANYMTKYLPASMGWIFWDKGQRICNSDGELAYTSFGRALRVAEYNRVELLMEGTIHPTQKPVVLYRWILTNYAEAGWKILDTHMGSQSSRIAAFNMGFDYWGWEIDAEYFEAGNKRFKEQTAQIKLFM